MKAVILQRMGSGELNPHPIQILVRYWDIPPSQMGVVIDDWIRRGVQRVATFVPWQAVESDISHSLPKFLQAAAERKVGVSLIMTPEVGVHYSHSGLPKDLFVHADQQARHAGGGVVPVLLPPQGFALPSLCHSEFLKRYHNYLARLDSLLADLLRSSPRLLDRVTAVLSGSFWKYYRSSIESTQDPFEGIAGDYSNVASLLFRQRLDQFYAQREFSDPTPLAANRWKTRKMEALNRLWFNQQCEDLFRIRSSQFVRKKAFQMRFEPIELFTPEADPGFFYSQVLQIVQGSYGDFSRLVQILDSATSRASQVGDLPSVPVVQWTGLGGFAKLADSEKQFLILKSLLLTAGKGGYVLIPEEEWFSLSAAFRSRVESMARAIESGELVMRNRVVFLTPHLWSHPGPMWKELAARVGSGASLVSNLDLIQMDEAVHCVVVDPQMVLTRDSVLRLLAMARAGKMVLFPRSSLYSESARIELEQGLVGLETLDLHVGLVYQLFRMGEGRVVLYDPPQTDSTGKMSDEASYERIRRFLNATLSVAGIEPPCSLSDGRLSILELEKRGGGLGLFILNPTSRAVSADLIFNSETTVSDLALSMGSDPSQIKSDAEPVAPATRFHLEVPPCGILPISAAGLGAEAEERRVAATTADVMKNHAARAASGELAGFDEGEEISSLWN